MQHGTHSPQATAPPTFTVDDGGFLHRLGTISMVGTATFAVIVVALHFLEPDFDASNRFVSEYVLGDWGLLMNAAFFGLGTGLLAAGLGLARVLAPSRRVRAIRNLYVVSAVGVYLSGLFNSDEVVDGEVIEVTAQGAIHDLSGFISFFCMITATFLLRRAFLATPGWEHRAEWALVAGVANIAGLVGTASGSDWFGYAQRAFLVLIVSWLITQARWIRRAS